MQCAAQVRPVEGQQAGFEGDEGDRVGGLDAGAEAFAGIGIQPARNVEGQARTGLGVEGLDPFCVEAFGGALQADAEEGIHHQFPAVRGRGRHVGRDLAALGEPGRPGRGGIGGQAGRIAGKRDRYRMTGAVQMACQHEAVAAVVAGAAGDQHGAGLGEQAQGDGCRGGAGTLHQGGGSIRQSPVLDVTDGRNGVDRTGGARHGFGGTQAHGVTGGYALPSRVSKAISRRSNRSFSLMPRWAMTGARIRCQAASSARR